MQKAQRHLPKLLGNKIIAEDEGVDAGRRLAQSQHQIRIDPVWTWLLTYQIIDNFAAGLDTRKSPLTSPAGTLTRLVNAVITPGGEIAKRRAFVQVADRRRHVRPGGDGILALRVRPQRRRRRPPAMARFPASPSGGRTIPNGDADLDQTDYDVFDGKIYLACQQPRRWSTPLTRQCRTRTTTPRSLTGGAGQGLLRPHLPVQDLHRAGAKYLYFLRGRRPAALGAPPTSAPATSTCRCRTPTRELLTSLEVYYDKLAIFSTEAVQIWAVDPDDAAERLRPAAARHRHQRGRARRCSTAPATCSTSTRPASAR